MTSNLVLAIGGGAAAIVALVLVVPIIRRSGRMPDGYDDAPVEDNPDLPPVQLRLIHGGPPAPGSTADCGCCDQTEEPPAQPGPGQEPFDFGTDDGEEDASA